MVFKKYLQNIVDSIFMIKTASTVMINKCLYRSTPFEGYYVNRKEDIYSTRRNIILSPRIDKDGYHEVTMMEGDHTIAKTVHRLVAEAWLPNPDNLPFVNHKNGNRDDNRVENLEWVSISDNNRRENQNNGRTYIYDGKRINREKSHLKPLTR